MRPKLGPPFTTKTWNRLLHRFAQPLTYGVLYGFGQLTKSTNSHYPLPMPRLELQPTHL
jgi:hypothetical protein